MHGVEETNIKVASRYSEEERKERIVRYLKKRNQRNFNKTIKVLTILLFSLNLYKYIVRDCWERSLILAN